MILLAVLASLMLGPPPPQYVGGESPAVDDVVMYRYRPDPNTNVTDTEIGYVNGWDWDGSAWVLSVTPTLHKEQDGITGQTWRIDPGEFSVRRPCGETALVER
jgi:hypothetical protein